MPEMLFELEWCHFYLGAGSFPWPEKNWQCQSWNPQQNQFDTNLCLISFSLEARSWLMIKAPISAPSPIFLLFIITIQMCYIPNKIRLRILRSNSSPSPLLSLSLCLSILSNLSFAVAALFIPIQMLPSAPPQYLSTQTKHRWGWRYFWDWAFQGWSNYSFSWLMKLISI